MVDKKKLTKQQQKKESERSQWEFVQHIRRIQNSTHKEEYVPYCEYTEHLRRTNTST
jgi:hypothetical protein